MSRCELCGREDCLKQVSVEEVLLKVCPNCSRYGTEKTSSVASPARRPIPISNKPEPKLVDNFSEIIKNKRNALGLTLAEFSTLINERESIVSKWQSGQMKPSVELAKKLEKKLGLALVVMEPVINSDAAGTNFNHNVNRPGELTVGDFIKIKTGRERNSS